MELYLGPAWQVLEDAITTDAGISLHSRPPAYEQHIAEEGGLALEVSTSTVCRSVLTPPGPGGPP